MLPERIREPNDYLTTRDVAKLFDTTTDVIRKWVQLGKITPEPKPGPKYASYFTQDEVRRFANERYGDGSD